MLTSKYGYSYSRPINHVYNYIWDKLFKKGISRPYHFKFFYGCLQQILLGLFFNTFSQLYLPAQKEIDILKAVLSASTRVKLAQEAGGGGRSSLPLFEN